MLFENVPEVVLPESVTPPSKAQDTLAGYAMAQQRHFDLERRLAAERELILDLEKRLTRCLKDGEEVSASGVTVVKVKRSLFFDFQ